MILASALTAFGRGLRASREKCLRRHGGYAAGFAYTAKPRALEGET